MSTDTIESPTNEAETSLPLVSKLMVWLPRIIPLVLLAVALYVLDSLLQRYNYHEILAEVSRVNSHQLSLAILLCAANYIVLTFYDFFALRYVKRELSLAKTAFTSFLGYSFSQNLGFSVLSGGAVRFRFYTAWGLNTAEVGQVIGFSAWHFWAGLLAITGIAFLIEPHELGIIFHLPDSVPTLVGIACLIPIVWYLLRTIAYKKPLQIRAWKITVPNPALAISSLLVAMLDWALAAAVLYALLPETPPFLLFLAAYLGCQTIGVISHVPGGLGIFETSMLLVLGNSVPADTLIGALLVYRAVYYLGPFILGTLLFGAFELFVRLRPNQRVREFTQPIENLLQAVVPQLLSISTFIGGGMLLFSGATPTVHDRLWWVRDIVPLTVLEASHFLNSIVAVALMLLAWGIRKRISAAYGISLLLLGLGAILTFVKGFDYEEATCLLVTMLAVIPCQKYFYRKANLLSGFSVASLIAIIAMLLASIWLGFFSYKHVEYAHQLWWDFTFDGDAPRFLRASLGAALVTLVAGVRAAFRAAMLSTADYPRSNP